MSTPISRRQLLRGCGCGFGYLALSALLAEKFGNVHAASPLAAHAPQFTARAKRVIFLFMHGGPSHLETFDPKPRLVVDQGKSLSTNNVTSDNGSKILPSQFAFNKHGKSGIEISEVFPELAKHADDLCVIRSMHTNGQDHNQAVLKLHTGMEAQLRPSMGAWVLYGLGTENQNLPGFVTISPSPITGGAQNYGSAFLPAIYQGTPIGSAGMPLARAQIRNIKNPRLNPELQRMQLDYLQGLNRNHLEQAHQDAQLEATIESFELAFRMQSEAPQLADLTTESEETLKLYGINEQPTDDFGRQCLLARRFAEKGVRFIQVSHSFKWDQHQNLKRDTARNASEVDKPIAGLLADLKSRGLLKDTLIVWGGEFGRTPTAQGADGRDHNPSGFSMWMAGGGVKGGHVHGATDDFGKAAVVDKVHMHDLHATILHLLGLDHQKLTYRHAGRDYRLTDVYGRAVTELLA